MPNKFSWRNLSLSCRIRTVISSFLVEKTHSFQNSFQKIPFWVILQQNISRFLSVVRFGRIEFETLVIIIEIVWPLDSFFVRLLEVYVGYDLVGSLFYRHQSRMRPCYILFARRSYVCTSKFFGVVKAQNLHLVHPYMLRSCEFCCSLHDRHMLFLCDQQLNYLFSIHFLLHINRLLICSRLFSYSTSLYAVMCGERVVAMQ